MDEEDEKGQELKTPSPVIGKKELEDDEFGFRSSDIIKHGKGRLSTITKSKMQKKNSNMEITDEKQDKKVMT